MGRRRKGILNTCRYTVTTRTASALRWAAMRAILMFHNCEGQSHKTVSTDNFWRERRAEADSNRGPSACLTARSNRFTCVCSRPCCRPFSFFFSLFSFFFFFFFFFWLGGSFMALIIWSVKTCALGPRPAASRAEEVCESRGGRPGLSSLISLRFLWT